MTQVKCTQEIGAQVALRRGADTRSLAQRRAAFAAQMRDMALNDLAQVAARINGLHDEWSRVDGREWTQQEIAQAVGVAYRTYQSWANAENENRDGRGYDKIARWYSRKLKRKVTRNWIMYGDAPGKPAVAEGPAEVPSLKRVEDQIALMRVEQAKALGKLRSELASLRKSLEPAPRIRKDKRS